MGVQRERTLYENLPVQPVDTTGAGDAFAGALATAIVDGDPMADAVAVAHAAAAAIAMTTFGARPLLPTRRELQDLLRSTYA